MISAHINGSILSQAEGGGSSFGTTQILMISAVVVLIVLAGFFAMAETALTRMSKIRALTSGVASEIAATPAAVNHRLPRAQATALSCSAPSVFMMSQPAPSRQ